MYPSHYLETHYMIHDQILQALIKKLSIYIHGKTKNANQKRIKIQTISKESKQILKI